MSAQTCTIFLIFNEGLVSLRSFHCSYLLHGDILLHNLHELVDQHVVNIVIDVLVRRNDEHGCQRGYWLDYCPFPNFLKVRLPRIERPSENT